MVQARGNRFTIYDALDASGYFDRNPANVQARDKVTGESLYRGPVLFPAMFYHPEGEQKITVAAEAVATPFGPKWVGEQRELIYEIANNEVEAEALRAEGWHDHPAKAIRRRVEIKIESDPAMPERVRKQLLASIPQISSDTRIKHLEAELDRLRKLVGEEQERKAADGAASQAPRASAAPVPNPLAMGASPPLPAPDVPRGMPS